MLIETGTMTKNMNFPLNFKEYSLINFNEFSKKFDFHIKNIDFVEICFSNDYELHEVTLKCESLWIFKNKVWHDNHRVNVFFSDYTGKKYMLYLITPENVRTILDMYGN